MVLGSHSGTDLFDTTVMLTKCYVLNQAGVRTRDKLMLIDTTVHRPEGKDWVSMYRIVALGNGTAVVLSNCYKSLLLSVETGSLVVKDTIVPIPVDQVPG